MIPNYTKVHLKFKLNGINYTFDDLMEVAYSFVKEGLPYQLELGNFLLDWLDNNDYVIVKTSGSTGKPKKIKIKKQSMVNSAIATGNFFKLKPGNKALHCLPSNFIAGKMMMVRAIILGLELDIVMPKVQLTISAKKQYHFCALTPMQLKNLGNNLKRFKTIIVGGGQVSKSILTTIQSVSSSIYETYGMTETVSHIAVKKLNNFDKKSECYTERVETSYFKTLPNVKVSVDDRNCLIIDAPNLSNKKVITNDIVKLHSETEFEWLGRYDNVINSGGIKLFPEQIETKLQNIIPNRFFVSSLPDDTLGEKLILIIESKEPINPLEFDALNPYEKPKEIFIVEKFQETKSGKIQREKTLKTIKFTH